MKTLKKAFDLLEKMYPVWKRVCGRSREIEKTIGELRGVIVREYREEYELRNMLKEIEIKEISERINGRWKPVKDLDRVLKLCFGREFRGSFYPYNCIWVFPEVPEINQKKTWLIIKGEWK
jgi:hypothetical protein